MRLLNIKIIILKFLENTTFNRLMRETHSEYDFNIIECNLTNGIWGSIGFNSYTDISNLFFGKR